MPKTPRNTVNLLFLCKTISGRQGAFCRHAETSRSSGEGFAFVQRSLREPGRVLPVCKDISEDQGAVLRSGKSVIKCLEGGGVGQPGTIAGFPQNCGTGIADRSCSCLIPTVFPSFRNWFEIIKINYRTLFKSCFPTIAMISTIPFSTR